MARVAQVSTSVHPRVCGELEALRLRAAGAVGSSPRVRGTRRGLDGDDHVEPVHPRVCGELGALPARLRMRRRFIPACAGNSQGSWQRPPSTPVHPRVCGELTRPQLAPRDVGGSSPRVRGTRARYRISLPTRRFIPACAGNSGRRARALTARTVHPRVCGELRTPLHFHPPTHGSSPRVRGTRRRTLSRQQPVRFIPACAGNSSKRTPISSTTPVHPRVCGELAPCLASVTTSAGSSPRVRGTRRERQRALGRGRFIPACAGNSCSSCCSAVVGDGSSPRVRGTRASNPCASPRHRFIPACAGNSAYQIRARRGLPVHPRVCGELPGPNAHRRSHERFIPACAGNSSPRR